MGETVIAAVDKERAKGKAAVEKEKRGESSEECGEEREERRENNVSDLFFKIPLLTATILPCRCIDRKPRNVHLNASSHSP